jgi:hypothetical protein
MVMVRNVPEGADCGTMVTLLMMGPLKVAIVPVNGVDSPAASVTVPVTVRFAIMFP